MTQTTPKVSVKQAVLLAADFIENNPESYYFGEDVKPTHCGGQGCMLGWIGFFAGAKEWRAYYISIEVLDTAEDTFYARISELVNKSNFTGSAKVAARGLRKYAEEYL